MVLTARMVGAEEALRAGLVTHVHPPDELLPAATALAREIADNTSQVSIAVSRHMLWRMLGAAHPMEAHRIDSRGIASLGRAADVREGVQSFLEKRPPVFPNRVSTDLPAFFPWWEEPDFS
jgi:enoyl-CoA hydratase/carnithine racemase